MRLGLIGDVHAEDEHLHVALDALVTARVDRILCSGDIVDGVGDVDRTCTLLARHNVLTVRGNHDRWIREDEMRTLPNAQRMTDLAPTSVEWLKSLPVTITLDVPFGKLLLCHGVGTNDMQRITPDDGRRAISSNEDLLKVLFDPTIAFMVFGHTHEPMARSFERGVGNPALVVVNAGSLARDEDPSFAILDTVARRVDFHHIGRDRTVSAVSRATV